jgi:hypothetical protein
LLTALEKRNLNRLNDSCNRACLNLVSASLARNTWKRYDSAYRLWERFCEENSLSTGLTDFGKEKRNFIVWCWEKTNLAVSTVRAYLGVLKQIKMLVSSLENEGEWKI